MMTIVEMSISLPMPAIGTSLANISDAMEYCLGAMTTHLPSSMKGSPRGLPLHLSRNDELVTDTGGP